ncbi:MAG: hydroxymethylpyrimidine/phosphomethylpyrimidine kinase [Chromatiales bacterium]|nr:hydroxymethylpyrimidine/phosphomethylpyrimidine kinase [Chromatiales bacterium]
MPAESPRVPRRPVVLVFAGHDPGGGAGIQADIEAIGAMGAHAATVVTALTVQDTVGVTAIGAVSSESIRAQAGAILADCPVAAIKTGLLPSAEIVETVAGLVRGCGVPLVVDPVLRSGAGDALTDPAVVRALIERLLPLATISTPNAAEACALAGLPADRAATAASDLSRTAGCSVLLTGGDVIESPDEVVNRLFAEGRERRQWRWPRLPGAYHGSGCTLAAALAARLAAGDSLDAACELAQSFTDRALGAAFRSGRGQLIPGRRGGGPATPSGSS